MQFAPVLWAGGLSLSLISLQLAVDVVGVADGLRQANLPRRSGPVRARSRSPSWRACSAAASRAPRRWATSWRGWPRAPRARGLRDALAEALSDPSVELAYWVPESGGYVDADGARVELPGPGDARRWAEVTHDGKRVGAIVTTGGSTMRRSWSATIASAAGLRMENERLDAELRARLEELRASRARIVEAGYRERRRVERDLHDGAQQRLMALALNLKLARSKMERRPRRGGELLDEATAELEQATAELRELARGIHPGLLTDRGLVPALEALASRAPVPVELTAEVEQRPGAGVEAATYFLVSEALANVAKHAEARAGLGAASVRATASLTVEVVDDGTRRRRPGRLGPARAGRPGRRARRQTSAWPSTTVRRDRRARQHPARLG